MSKPFLHQLHDAKELFLSVSNEKKIPAALIEKDYWIMHCLRGLQDQGYDFEMKGGTSLSKGYDIIERFSEDIDIKFLNYDDLQVGKNHDKTKHILARKQHFDLLSQEIKINGLNFERAPEFDDVKMRNAGIRGTYQSYFDEQQALKKGILLEVGFDTTTPYEERTITSWAFEKAINSGLKDEIIDNRAINVKCYKPEYTFVEKLQTISTKFRKQQKEGKKPSNFIRNYYDVYQLLLQDRVIDFIGSEPYYEHKAKRFRKEDEKDLKSNEAFILRDSGIREEYSQDFMQKSALYYGTAPKFEDILSKIQEFIEKM